MVIPEPEDSTISNPYQQPSLTGYNSNPPPDDDSNVAANAVEWQKHLDKIGDPLKTFAEAVDSNVSSAFDKIFGANITSQAGNYTLTTADQGKFLEFTAAATLTLLPAATAGSNFPIAVINNSTGAVTIDGDSSETINGETTITIRPGEGAILTCDGSSWVGVVETSFANAVTTQSSDLTVTAAEGGSIIEFDTGATLTLQAAADAENGFTLGVVNNASADVTIDADTSETINGSTTLVLSDGESALLFCDGSKWVALHTRKPAVGTVQATTSGTAKDFTGIPPWVTRIDVLFDDVSLDGNDRMLVQIGDAGGIEESGYTSTGVICLDANTVAGADSSGGFGIVLGGATRSFFGIMTIVNITGNTWVAAGHGRVVSQGVSIVGGSKSLTDTLTQLRITVSSSNAFDSGQVNIRYS